MGQDTGRAASEATSFADDLAQRMAPELVSQLLAEAIPAVARAGIHLTEVTDGGCRGRLPLTRENTNQHGTHQALLVGMLGDYTGGSALASVVRGVPVVGIHPVFGAEAILLWLVSAELKYLEPSCEDLEAVCVVPEALRAGIRDRFWAGETQLVPLEVRFQGVGGTPVAVGRLTYYFKHAATLRPSSKEKRGGTMYRHLLKSSARLVAHVRGREAGRADRLYDDPWSRAAAGRHGELLGERFLEVLPTLAPMVEARTAHADASLTAALDAGVTQVVLVGAGLDFRPFRFADRASVRWFELDLPEMLEERARVLEGHALPPCDRTAVPLNLDFDDPAEILAGTAGFDPGAPVFVVYEGCSMYFEAPRAHDIFGRLARLVRRHPASRLWLDLVTPEVVGRDAPEAARAFVEGMAKMGEPFVFGHSDPQALFADHGLAVEAVARSNHYRPSDDPLFELYYFAVLGPAEGGGPEATAG